MLSAIILTKNEEANIEDAIHTAAFCDEVLVVDNGSTDKTVDLAKKAGARVITNMDPSFSERRNAAAHEAKGDWLLYIDADERISGPLQQEISTILNTTPADVFYVRREDIFWGKPVRYGEVSKAYNKGIIRLMKKGTGTWRGAVHEEFFTQGNPARLNNTLTHYSHSGIKEFLESINEYSSLRAEELYNAGIKVSLLDLTIRPALKFMYTYFILKGYKDGAAGYVYSFMMSFHAFLVRSKVYLLRARAAQTKS